MKPFTMMTLLVCSIVPPASPTARAAPHVSSHTSTHRTSLHVDDHALDWHSDDRSLRLHDGPNGVKVPSVMPDGWLSLHRDDLILAVDGETVTTIQSLQRALANLGTHAAALTIRTSHGDHRDMTLTRDDYAPWLPDAPEPPPLPRVTTTR